MGSEQPSHVGESKPFSNRFIFSFPAGIHIYTTYNTGKLWPLIVRIQALKVSKGGTNCIGVHGLCSSVSGCECMYWGGLALPICLIHAPFSGTPADLGFMWHKWHKWCLWSLILCTLLLQSALHVWLGNGSQVQVMSLLSVHKEYFTTHSIHLVNVTL